MTTEFAQRYINRVLALHNEMGLDSKDDAETRIRKLLRSLVEFSATQKPPLDIAAILKDVSTDIDPTG